MDQDYSEDQKAISKIDVIPVTMLQMFVDWIKSKEKTFQQILEDLADLDADISIRREIKEIYKSIASKKLKEYGSDHEYETCSEGKETDYDDHYDEIGLGRLNTRKNLKKLNKPSSVQQKNASKEIVENIKKNIIFQLIIADPQAGKTGTVLSIITDIVWDNHFVNIYSHKNIYILTGLSSVEWKEQTVLRFPENMDKQVFHRPDLKSKLGDLKNKKDMLIIIDETHIAARENQSIAKMFREAGFFDENYLKSNNIKFLEFTATPDGVLYDFLKWQKDCKKVLLECGDEYKGIEYFIKNKKILQYKDLCESEKVDKHLREIEKVIKDNYKEPRYHIIRLPTGNNYDKVYEEFESFFSNKIIKFDLKNKEKDINNFLSKKPKKHTFIFVKEKARVAKTFDTSHLGLLYERYSSKISDSVIIQGLLGRMCGYTYNGSICFTNLESATKYLELKKSKFENCEEIEWNSLTTKTIKGKTNSKKTFNHPENFDSDYEDDEKENEVVFINYEHQNSIIKYCRDNLKVDVRPFYPDEDGFCRNTIRGVKKIYSLDYVYKNKGQGLNEKSTHRQYACYTNINDPSSVRFIVCHLKNN